MVYLAYSGAGGTQQASTRSIGPTSASSASHGLTIHGHAHHDRRHRRLAVDVVAHAVGRGRPAAPSTRPAPAPSSRPRSSSPTSRSPTPPPPQHHHPALQLRAPRLVGRCDEGPRSTSRAGTDHGRDWQARVGPSGLQETGPQVDRIDNRVVVAYNDVTGIARTVGPTGSGANTIDDTPRRPATRPTPSPPPGSSATPPPSNIGVSTAAAAIAVGQAFLVVQKAAVDRGQASIVGVCAGHARG